MNGSGLFEQGRQAEMGVCEASLPRLTAQGLLWSARHPPPDNNFTSLTSDYLPLAPAERRKRKVAMQGRPVYDVHGLVCVALWLGFHHISGFPRGAVRKSSIHKRSVRPPFSGEPPPSHLPGLRWESARLGATVYRLRGAWLVRWWGNAMEGSFHSRAEARQHHAELRRTAETRFHRQAAAQRAVWYCGRILLLMHSAARSIHILYWRSNIKILYYKLKACIQHLNE